jgi:hypothetical protein
MAHEITRGWRFQIQRSLRGFGIQRRFAAFQGRAFVELAI